MISSQRQHLILSRLRTRGAVRITALSKELGVSAMTIRRDIADLADNNAADENTKNEIRFHRRDNVLSFSFGVFF